MAFGKCAMSASVNLALALGNTIAFSTEVTAEAVGEIGQKRGLPLTGGPLAIAHPVQCRCEARIQITKHLMLGSQPHKCGLNLIFQHAVDQ